MVINSSFIHTFLLYSRIANSFFILCLFFPYFLSAYCRFNFMLALLLKSRIDWIGIYFAQLSLFAGVLNKCIRGSTFPEIMSALFYQNRESAGWNLYTGHQL